MKNIIERNLPLTEKYNLIDKTYISLIDGGGSTCDNCGRLIANIATVRNESKKTFNIGLDCLETVLLNNNLLDGKSIAEFQHFKKHIKSYINNAKKIVSEFIDVNKHLQFEALRVEVNDFKRWSNYGKRSYLTFHYIYNGGQSYNSNIKLSNEIDLNDFLTVVESITKLKIIKE